MSKDKFGYPDLVLRMLHYINSVTVIEHGDFTGSSVNGDVNLGDMVLGLLQDCAGCAANEASTMSAGKLARPAARPGLVVRAYKRATGRRRDAGVDQAKLGPSGQRQWR